MDDAEATDPEDGDTEAREMTWGWGTAISVPVVLYLLYRVIDWLLQWLAGIGMDPSWF